MFDWIKNIFGKIKPVQGTEKPVIKPKVGVSEDKKRLIKEILSCFEQGRRTPKYDEIYVYNDGRNGRQITLGQGVTEEGNLKFLLTKYVAKKAKFSKDFEPYLPKVAKVSLVNDAAFKNLLVRAAREDQVYRDLLDDVFDEKYIYPAFEWAKKNGFKEVLSYAIAADTYLHSGTFIPAITNRFPEKTPANGGRESVWMKSYLEARKDFLRNHKRTILNKLWTRPQFYLTQLEKGNWDLNMFPIAPNGVSIKS